MTSSEIKKKIERTQRILSDMEYITDTVNKVHGVRIGIIEPTPKGNCVLQNTYFYYDKDHEILNEEDVEKIANIVLERAKNKYLVPASALPDSRRKERLPKPLQRQRRY